MRRVRRLGVVIKLQSLISTLGITYLRVREGRRVSRIYFHCVPDATRLWETIIHLQSGQRSLDHVGIVGGSIQNSHFTSRCLTIPMQAIRYNNSWSGVKPRPYEPERQTADIVWMKLRGIQNPYLVWNAQERRIARLLANVAPE